MAQKKKIGKKLAALIIIVLAFFAVSGVHLLEGFRFIEGKSYDWRVRFWANTGFNRPSDDIVVILLDQDSIDWAQKERGWGWPWPREAYAEIVDFMNLSGAKSIAFDVLFSEPSIYRSARQDEIIDSVIGFLEEMMVDTGGTAYGTGGERRPRPEALYGQPQAETEYGQPRPRMGFRAVRDDLLSLSAWEDDAIFVDASRDFGRVVQAVMFSSQTGNVFYWPEDLEVPLFHPDNFDPIIDRFMISEEMRGQFPIHGLKNSAGALGSVTGVPDPDGVIRRVQLFTIFDGKAIPGLSVASLLAAGYDGYIYYNQRNRSIEWGDFVIPVDRNGFTLLRFKADLDRYIPYRAKDILLSAEAHVRGEVLDFGFHVTEMGTQWINYTPINFTGAHVFFGFNAPGLYDIFSSPLTSLYPGVGFHITMLDNLLQQSFIRENTESANLLILLAIILLTVGLTMFANRITLSVSGIVVIILAIVIGSFTMYQFGGLWIPMVTFLVGAFVAFITVLVYNYATEGSQKRFIKSAFSQYLSPKVIEQIIQDPSQLKLGGEKKEMSAVFTDIRAFSTFSEALGDPTKLVDLLNFYLTKMSDIILENQGTIDKYVGDAIVGFFGAPIYMKNHASLACRSALMMKKAEMELNREMLERELLNPKVMEALFAKGKIKSLDDPCPVYTRLGINSGDMVVGNMGTPNKMNYTIMGNAVNLAARLEGVNDQYDTGGILISEYTRTHLGNEFVLRSLSRVRVVGINTPLRLYELLDITNEASPELLDMVKSWEQAFGFYEKRDFLAAKNIFQTICNRNLPIFGNTDLAAKKYLDRCAKYLSSPPDEKTWDDGVDNLTKK